MAEAERMIGTPDTPDAAGAGPEQSDDRTPPGERPRLDSVAASEKAPAETPSVAEPASGAAERSRGRRRIAVLFAVAAFAYALDLISKIIVVAKLEHHAPAKIFGDWLQLEVIRNSGAAFSFGEAYTVIFTVIAAAVIVVIMRLARKLYSLPWAIALGLLLGGALGNLTDRIFRAPGVFQGAVVDFISPKHFAVFNLGDSAIVCGGILIVLLSFLGLDPDGTVHKD
ncbi:signal peptidase II [Streptomyces colonosanans]|uniref:Lipoprotein signal peptidase n=1 Tax=Streptomyces colonosanans TaxID=1428652 RepID=A0A1S2PTS6_9ACTN|nr:signal peptidase II [Streptomyces colonosanans]OIJ97163.1 signal peptidase II [Streptomyces colonosanans]